MDVLKRFLAVQFPQFILFYHEVLLHVITFSVTSCTIIMS